jgi:beta propeller repeat protein
MNKDRHSHFSRIWSLALLIPLIMGGFTTANRTRAAQALPTASAPSLIVGGVGNQMNPSLVGDTLVYDDCPLPYQPCTLSAYDFATQSSYQVATNVEYIDGQNSVQRTDGVTAAWIEGNDQNLRTTSLADIYTPDYLHMPGQKRDAAVWGDIVVWTDLHDSQPDSPPNGDIFLLDLSSAKASAISNHEFDQSHPATNGKVVVWQDNRNAGANGFNTDIYGYDITTRKEFVVANSANSELTPAISGNTVVWVSQGLQNNATTIMGYDLQARSSFIIARAGAPTEPDSFVGLNNPAIWGNLVVWVRNEYPQGPGYALRSGIYGYDLTSGEQFSIVDDDKAIRLSPSVSGNRAVWVEIPKTSFSDGRREIMGATISGVTAVPVDVPTPKPAPTSRTFPETGRTVTGIFLDYWLKHGGLPQQGYPISRVMNVISDLDGKAYTVQYFERAVFEAHPENKAPYDVLLSQLGTFQYRKKYPDPQRPNPTEGTIKGKLSYPSEVIPSLAVYAIAVDGSGKYHSVRTWANSLEYTIEGVAPGTYYVVAYIADTPNSFLNMAYTEAAKCQQANPNNATNCNDHTLIRVKVDPRQTVEGISPTDFAPQIPFPPQPAAGPEAGACQTFQQTGKLLCGAFLQYWYAHGGLAQQGYPISTPFHEVSDLDGKEYIVQYFERAVFELHPENKPPYDVLLSQLGTFRYRDDVQP